MYFGLEGSSSFLYGVNVFVDLGDCALEFTQSIFVLLLLLLLLLEVKCFIHKLLGEQVGFGGKLSFNVELHEQLLVQVLEFVQIRIMPVNY